MMDDDTLDRVVWEYYEGIVLPEDAMVRILEAAPARSVVVPFHRRSVFRWSLGAAAALALMVTAAGVAGYRPAGAESTRLAHQVLDVYDHHLDPDVYSSDLQSIEWGLNHTDFSIVPSDHSHLKGYAVVGARKCQYSGKKAVQVILVGKDSGREGCLYVLPYDKAFDRIREPDVYVGNDHISMWRDGDRMFALYEPGK